ncbi:MAG: pyridoxamine 5'-phosphate oxidase [Bdellovibrionales bacterium]|nr:pyridoxamine 5'-phosphate oxidase [Bdellovibrionales bacterium]
MKPTIDIETDPMALFSFWYEQASGKIRGESVRDQILFPLRKLARQLYPPFMIHGGDAMVLATSTKDGHPSARVVLFKGIWERGVLFYTNYHSRKSYEIEGNPFASLVFHWALPERQVRFEGRVDRVPDHMSDAYWASRPRGSQVGAWASEQSEEVANRQMLLDRVKEIEARFGNGPIPRPPHWGGYVLRPETIEFWEACAFRLHKRRRYRMHSGQWQSTLLCP